MRRKVHEILVVLLTTVLFLGCNNTKTHKQPNMIFIYTDDQRKDALGAYENEQIITPYIDKMASDAVMFSNANVVFALCSPSRAALLTGRYNSANGVIGLGSNLNNNEITVANYLKGNGYLTAVSGKWHLGQHPNNLGFDFHVFFESNGRYYNRKIYDMDTVVRPEIHCDEYCVDRSIDFLKNAAKKDQPFFLFHNTQLPHMNGKLIWDAKTETLEKYNSEDMPVAINRNDDLSTKPEYLKKVRNRRQAKKYGYPDSAAIQKHTKEYYSVITEMDDALGRLFETIEELGLRENTYIFFMSDNGWMLGEHGFTSKVLPYKQAVEVPFFVLGPDLEPASLDEIVLNIDMAPTMMEIAGIEKPESMHGSSFLSLLRNADKNWRSSFVYEGLGNYGGTKPNLTVISNDFRYVETYSGSTLDTVIYREVYNQHTDVEELENLIYSSEIQSLLPEFEKAIAEHKSTILNKK